MKAILTPLIILLLSHMSMAQDRELYFVSAETTDMRSGPGTNYNIVTQLSKGMQIDLISEDFGDWWTVQYRTMNGFVKAADLLAVTANIAPESRDNDSEPVDVVAEEINYDDWESTTYETGETPDCLNISPKFDYNLDNYLKVEVSENTEAVVKLYRVGNSPSEEKCYRVAYVKSGDTHLIKNIPAGKYYLKIAYGTDWKERTVNGKCIGKFIQKPLYKVGDQILDFAPKRLAQGMDVPSFELSLDVSIDGSGSSFDTDDISEKEFNN